MSLIKFSGSQSPDVLEHEFLIDFLERKWALSIECFHVFLLGGTGSGKSTFLNTLADLEVVETGVIRPTTSTIQVYGHECHVKSFNNFPCCFLSHHNDLLKEICIWDLPDMDSHCVANHESARLLREFADLLFIVLHPEKTHQKSLEDFLNWYPVIPQIAWVTHSASIPAAEASKIQEAGWANSSEIYLVDLKQDPQGARDQILKAIEGIKRKGMHLWKQEILKSLSAKGLETIGPQYEALKEEQIREESFLAAIVDFQTGIDLRLEDSLWIIFKEKVFGEIKQRILTEVLFASRSYFSSFSSLILRFSKESNVALDLPYMSIPLLRFEEVVPDLNLSQLSRECFLDSHRKLLLNCRVQLISLARAPSNWFFFLEILMDFIMPAIMLTWFLLYFKPVAAEPLPILALIFFLPVLFIFYWGRVQNRLKSVYRKGYSLYRHGLLEEMQKLLAERQAELEAHVRSRSEKLAEMESFLEKCQESLQESLQE